MLEKTEETRQDHLHGHILSGLVSAELPARLIARRKDIMIESAAYDIIKKEGFAEGRTTGHKEGLEQGLEQGLQKGRFEANRENAKNLLLLGILTDEQIAQTTGLTLEEILKLKQETEK